MPATFQAHCIGCPYHGRNFRLPLSMEMNSTHALLILQAPGEEEWQCRRPAVSANPRSTAKRLRKSLERIGKRRSDFSITNAVQCYPCKGSNQRDKKPGKKAKNSCARWLKADIEASDWQRIVVFGAIARKSVEKLGYGEDSRFCFKRHPSGCLKNSDLDAALRWALD